MDLATAQTVARVGRYQRLARTHRVARDLRKMGWSASEVPTEAVILIVVSHPSPWTSMSIESDLTVACVEGKCSGYDITTSTRGVWRVEIR